MNKIKKYLCIHKYILALLLVAIISHVQWINPFSILAFSDWKYWSDFSIITIFQGLGAWDSPFKLGAVNIQMYFYFFQLLERL